MDPRIFLISALVYAVSGVPVPENEITFTTTTTTTTADGLVEIHRNTSSVCESMLPIHGNNVPQNSEAPYLIKVNSLKVAPGGILEIQVQNKQDLKPMRGVYMQVRNSQRVPVGEFQPSNDNHVILSDCANGHNNAIMYVSHEPTDFLTFQWKAPQEPTEVKIYATFVLSFSEFWNPITSDTITVANY